MILLYKMMVGRIQENYFFYLYIFTLSTKQNTIIGRTHYKLLKGIHLVKLFKLQNVK